MQRCDIPNITFVLNAPPRRSLGEALAGIVVLAGRVEWVARVVLADW
jgi:hypothetical protein